MRIEQRTWDTVEYGTVYVACFMNCWGLGVCLPVFMYPEEKTCNVRH